MTQRLPIKKTYKLYIGGAFPRSESGRTYEAQGQNVARGSRKDARDAVQAARKAQPGWANATAYNRGQVIYRLAEMIEARVGEFAELCSGRDEVERTIDRIVWYAGWADKLPQVLGGSNPVAGPYFNFTVPEPTGVVAILAPDEPALLGLVTRVLPPVVGGNAVVVLASEPQPLAAVEFGEALATSDLPGGVRNIITVSRAEVAPHLAAHMDVNAIDLCGAVFRSGAGQTGASAGAGSVEPTPAGHSTELEEAAAENVKRVVRGRADTQSPWEIANYLELKTVWHPIGQ
jgi:acyl-CoA reductase-like NAD-dependent aldehyde dehydrogenase